MWKVNRKVGRGEILALLIVAAFDGSRSKEKVEIEDLSRMLAELVDKNVVDTDDFSITPGGEYSEDVARFVGNYLLSGYATTNSPVDLKPEGRMECRMMVLEALEDKEKFPEISKIAKTFEIDLNIIKKLTEHQSSTI